MSKKRDDGPGGRCTHPGCRRKATTWNNIGPETGDPVCDTHEARKRPRKPKPLVVRGERVAWIDSWNETCISAIGTTTATDTRRLSTWLAKAADWMESQRE